MRAARALARGATKAAAAREAGVDRATIGRWAKTPEFNDLILTAQLPEEDEEQAAKQTASTGLTARVEVALKVIDRGLAGDEGVTVPMAKLALDVIKAAKQFEPPSEEETGPSTLTSLIARLDEQGSAN